MTSKIIAASPSPRDCDPSFKGATRASDLDLARLTRVLWRFTLGFRYGGAAGVPDSGWAGSCRPRLTGIREHCSVRRDADRSRGRRLESWRHPTAATRTVQSTPQPVGNLGALVAQLSCIARVSCVPCFLEYAGAYGPRCYEPDDTSLGNAERGSGGSCCVWCGCWGDGAVHGDVARTDASLAADVRASFNAGDRCCAAYRGAGPFRARVGDDRSHSSLAGDRYSGTDRGAGLEAVEEPDVHQCWFEGLSARRDSRADHKSHDCLVHRGINWWRQQQQQ